MDLFSSMRASASGLEAQTKRINTISSNLANSETTRNAEGEIAPYKRQDPVFAAETDRESFDEILTNELDNAVQGVRVTEIAQDERPPRRVYQPNHVDAGPDGYVLLPNVNHVEEMANMISAQRAFESNVTALNAAKAMAQKSLEIGR